jgi:MYXO-CTERM domain-containing protein
MVRSIRRGVPAAIVSLLLGALLALAAPGAVAPVAAEATGGCRPVGGGTVSTAGPHRATVVVDTGSGTVWSACVTFSGTISGIEALELAAATIPGLAPVYEPYPGEGRAVCRLLGVGNDPPGCLGKTAEYWAYFRNGEYARGGGSRSVVRDGDVEGWSFSRGTAPRSATAGSEAVAASAVPTTAPPSTAPAPATPPSTTPAPVPSPSSTVVPGGPTGPRASDGAAPSSPSPSPAPGDTAPEDLPPPAGEGAEPGTEADGPAPGPGSSDDGSPDAPGPAAAADEAADSFTVTDADEGGGSAVASVVGFGAAVGALGAAGIVVHRRRRHLGVA